MSVQGRGLELRQADARQLATSPRIEMYDLKADPHETNNQQTTPKKRSTRERLGTIERVPIETGILGNQMERE